MTISMDHRNHRRSSWDSKMSISTVSTGRHFRRSPSSILSSDSDIRFTRNKLTSQYKCGCCVIATFLMLLLVAGAAVYIGYTFFLPEVPDEQIYRASFRVIEGDKYSSELADPSTKIFQSRARSYKERLNLLFRRSPLRHGYVNTEVLALDGVENENLIVHFNIHIDPYYVDVNELDVKKVLASQMTVEESPYFQNITIDLDSLEVKLEDLLLQQTTTLPTTAFSQAVTQAPEPPRVCSELQLSYCSNLPYNITTYPNGIGHRNIETLLEDMIAFRELVDAECYRHAYDYVCRVLQPSCRKGIEEDMMILPCRSYCKDFMAGCGSRLLEKYKSLLDCSRFPEYSEEGVCITKPGCVEELQSRALSPRICDGVVDCQDVSDERSCTYCPRDHLHCGIGRACIHKSKRCDGRKDCPDGSDERACLSLAPSIESVSRMEIVTPHLSRYHSEGYVVFNERGQIGKLCTENLNDSLTSNHTVEVLHTVASSLCKTLSYRNILSVSAETDIESNIDYVNMKDPTAPEISFVRTSCPSKQVLKVGCSELECGIQATRGLKADEDLPKMSMHGDWPWHAALFKEEAHICDGTLVAPQWLITTTSCFQGQPKAEWVARLGVVRLASAAPWEQERRIVGMVKSPVEGSTVALVKLHEPVAFTDFVRPACLPEQRMELEKGIEMHCNTLGWARNREQLQRVQVKVASMEKCENVSISSVNGVCAETYYGKDDCNEEEFAGSSMVCLHPKSRKWTLAAITNWRIACSQNGTERPRMYDKITSNIDWIKETISSPTS